MAEISEAPPLSAQPKESDKPPEPSNFDQETMRKTKPGTKRLILTLSVLFTFLLGLPFLLKSVEIYRSPLPFRDIDSLSAAIESSPILFPCHFHAIYVNFPATSSPSSFRNQLGISIHSRMQKLSPKTPLCGTCSNYSVTVTLDSNSLSSGLFSEYDRNSENFDESLDEYLNSALNKDGYDNKKVYTVVVVNREDVEEVRAVVGKYRHAWIEGRMAREEEVVQRIAEIFVKVFVNGGKEEGSIHGEFMPIGADGRVVLSFNLLNADPRDWVYDWYLRFSMCCSSALHISPCVQLLIAQ